MYVRRYRRNLELQLNSRKCQEAFRKLKKEHSIFRLYPTKESLIELLKPGNKNYKDKDKVMAILLDEFQKDNAIYPLINILFWDSLYRLYCQRRSRVPDPEALFGRIQWDFYHTLINHNLDRLSKKIDVNIFLNTKKKVIAWEKENISYREEIKEIENLYKAGLSPADIVQSETYPEEREAYLLDKVYRKVISRTQYDLILETLVYKRMNQREWAEKNGIPYSTVRNLRYRAEMAIRNFEKEENK